MANVYASVSIRVLDALGAEGSTDDVVFAVPEAVTLTQFITRMVEYVGHYNAVTDGAIVGVTAKFDIFEHLSGLRDTPVAGSEIERVGLSTYDQATIPASYSTRVLAVAESVIAAGKIDQANADWIAWRDDVFAASGIGIQAVTKARNVFISFMHGMIKFRKYRREEDRKSYDIE